MPHSGTATLPDRLRGVDRQRAMNGIHDFCFCHALTLAHDVFPRAGCEKVEGGDARVSLVWGFNISISSLSPRHGSPVFEHVFKFGHLQPAQPFLLRDNNGRSVGVEIAIDRRRRDAARIDEHLHDIERDRG